MSFSYHAKIKGEMNIFYNLAWENPIKVITGIIHRKGGGLLAGHHTCDPRIARTFESCQVHYVVSLGKILYCTVLYASHHPGVKWVPNFVTSTDYSYSHLEGLSLQDG